MFSIQHQYRKYFTTITLVFVLACAYPQKQALPVFQGNDGKMQYTPDEKGNRVPDFSYCGYDAGNTAIPFVETKVFVTVQEDDATETIQNAIDYVSGLPLDKDGFRGAILLDKGTFKVEGRLRITSSGIILRGSGIGDLGTTLIATGKSRETLIRIFGEKDIETEEEILISDTYVPVGSMTISVSNPDDFKTGDKILIRRPTTKNWVDMLEMHHFGGGRESESLGWHPGRNNIIWDRTITNIEGNTITLDAPLTTALDTTYGGGYISKYSWSGRINNIGIENLNLLSEYDISNKKDEDHCWFAITFENAADCWVRQVNFKHFAGSAVAVYETVKKVTIEDCISLEPVSEIGGQRRYTFFTMGQQCLFQRCYAEYGYHDFSVGYFTPGPNAFVQCEAYLPYNFSGTINRWASGVLFDLVNIDGNALSLKNLYQKKQGAGWTAANCMLWQCSAAQVECFTPPTAQNWAYGIWGQFSSGYKTFWFEANSHISPRSLYYAQLKDRMGETAMERADFIPNEFGSTSSPTIKLAAELTKKAYESPVQLKDWIADASARNPINIEKTDTKEANDIVAKKTLEHKLPNAISLDNGWLTDRNGVVTGTTMGIQWWRGDTRPHTVNQSRPHITRYVPGRTGTGLTDDIGETVSWMNSNNILAIDHHYGLWYDRRRMDHERIRRMDGDVWPPFYEQPFARSGQGLAWDGLSKYDLTKPNYFYWSRLKQYADLSEQSGKILIHQNYFQHNILEAGAHYADFPWRPANNINFTPFPEPAPYAGDKRIFIAEQFYNVNDEHYRELHKQYIYQCLNNFADNSNVIQLISEEFTGPLHFVEFWLDVIAEWEKETGKNALVGLSVTKDVQDAILKNKTYAPLIDVIDIKYWHIKEDGSLYAYEEGKNLAPRQFDRLEKKGKPSFETVYKAVSDYKLKYPGKAVIYSNWLDHDQHWAVFMASGSMAAIPSIRNEFTISATSMRISKSSQEGVYKLENELGEQIIYLRNIKKITIELTPGLYSGNWINTETGEFTEIKQITNEEELTSPFNGDGVLWIRKK